MSESNVFLRRTAAGLVGAAGLWLFCRCLLVPLLPFLLALGLSALLEPWVRRLSRRLGGHRRAAAAVVTTGVLAGLGGALGLLVLALAAELRTWSDRLPAAMAAFPAAWNGILDRMAGWYAASPPFLRTALDGLADHLTAEGPSLAGALGERLMGAASRLLAALPEVGLFFVTTVLAVYFTSLSYPAILAFLKAQLPPAWQGRCRAAARCCRRALLQWLRSELTLIAVTFLLLLAGFHAIGLDLALLAAAFTALVDALPVLGVGTVLVPCALGCLLLGRTGQALALAALYALVSLTHSLLEPRLLAKQGGLPPIAALLAMYLGFRLLGVGGMLLAPAALLLLKQLHDAGVVRLWR